MPGAEPPGASGGRGVAELTEIVETLAGVVASLQEGRAADRALLGDLAGTVSELAAAPAKPDAVRPWLTVADGETAQMQLDLLARWLREVWAHYPGDAGGRALPPCWARHPWVVEELWAARGAWVEATGPRGSYTRLADWHDRTRTGVARRIAQRLGSCQPHQHRVGRAEDEHDQTVDTTDLDRIADTWTSTRRVHPTSTSSTSHNTTSTTPS